MPIAKYGVSKVTEKGLKFSFGRAAKIISARTNMSHRIVFILFYYKGY